MTRIADRVDEARRRAVGELRRVERALVDVVLDEDVVGLPERLERGRLGRVERDAGRRRRQGRVDHRPVGREAREEREADDDDEGDREADLRPARFDDVPGTAGGASSPKPAPGPTRPPPGPVIVIPGDSGTAGGGGMMGAVAQPAGSVVPGTSFRPGSAGRGGTVGRAVRVGCLVGTGGVHVVSRVRAPRTGAVSVRCQPDRPVGIRRGARPGRGGGGAEDAPSPSIVQMTALGGHRPKVRYRAAIATCRCPDPAPSTLRGMLSVLGGLGAALLWAAATIASSRTTRIVGASSAVAWVMLVGLAVALPGAVLVGVPAALDLPTVGWLVVVGLGNCGGLVLDLRRAAASARSGSSRRSPRRRGRSRRSSRSSWANASWPGRR